MRAGPARDEPNRVSLGVDPTRLRVDPAVAEGDLLERDEADRLTPRRTVEDRDDYVWRGRSIGAQPGFELVGGRDGDRTRDVDRAQASSFSGSSTKTGICRFVFAWYLS